jgi:sucrose phosphorylase
MEVLVEMHGHYEDQIGIAKRVDWVYDFALPPLVLHALYTGNGVPLKTMARRKSTKRTDGARHARRHRGSDVGP